MNFHIVFGSVFHIFVFLIYLTIVNSSDVQNITPNELNHNLKERGEISEVLTSSAIQAFYERNLFIRAIFTKYGSNRSLSFEGYEHLLENLKIGNIKILHSWESHMKDKTKLFDLHKSHNHSFNLQVSSLQDTIQPLGNRHMNYEKSKEISNQSLESDKRYKRGTKKEINENEEQEAIAKCFRPKELLNIYGFDENSDITEEDFIQLCPAIVSQIDMHACVINDDSHEDHAHDKDSIDVSRSLSDIRKEVWGYGTCAILVISISGLLVVSLIPLLQRMLMSSILHFLVALAVGALSGDALLHLIPHSLQPHGTEHDHDETSHSFVGVYKGLCGLAAIYFFLIFGRIQAIIGNRNVKKRSSQSSKVTETDITTEKEPKQNKPFIPDSDKEEKELDIIELGEDYKHSHSHSHDHDVPQTIPALAWRVIIGDGIHNLCDGLAIGVAFSNSITGGISTSIAVLCHELPHEMGDFAILLKKGMSVKQAILCNCISSLLSLMGMFTGIMLGNMGEVSLWIFVAIAGMFLYISLVDLIPEMIFINRTGTKKQIKHLILQISGMFTGSGIMFLIAMYEEELKRALDL